MFPRWQNLCAGVLLCTMGLSAGMNIGDLHSHYSEIFPSGNRNAASHKWATFALQHASSASEVKTLFQGFCAVSGSPLEPVDSKSYRMTLPSASDPSKTETGTAYFCCWPCVCDAADFLRVDTFEFKGETLRVLVVGDPCSKADDLFAPFTNAFDGLQTTLKVSAPEISCSNEGTLDGATLSSAGHPIVGILHEDIAGVGSDGSAMKDQCSQRAERGYDSGMGYIFQQFAKQNPVGSKSSPAGGAPVVAGEWRASRECNQIDDAKRKWLEGLVNSNPVVMVALRNARCTMDAEATFETESACFDAHYFDSDTDPLWEFLQCMYPEAKVNGMMMHSYVWVAQSYLGHGFEVSRMHQSGDLRPKLTAAGVDTSCTRDTSSCASLLPPNEVAELEKTIAENPVVLYGWSGCPCTSIARSRFSQQGVCYVETVWPGDQAPAFKYLQCVHGKEHHSFLFFGGSFKGNGFILEEATTPEDKFDEMLNDAGARLTCMKEGDKSLVGGDLKSCTQSEDGSTTGWTRSGSCNWDPSDSGYHEVCVTMSDKFLEASAKEDGNDLSSVVQAGGHWCICAWAFASAVQRDPQNLEGIELDCDRTNAKLIGVYESFVDANTKLTSPSGKHYEAYAPLQKVKQLCPKTTTDGDSDTAPAATKQPQPADDERSITPPPTTLQSRPNAPTARMSVPPTMEATTETTTFLPSESPKSSSTAEDLPITATDSSLESSSSSGAVDDHRDPADTATDTNDENVTAKAVAVSVVAVVGVAALVAAVLHWRRLQRRNWAQFENEAECTPPEEIFPQPKEKAADDPNAGVLGPIVQV